MMPTYETDANHPAGHSVSNPRKDRMRAVVAELQARIDAAETRYEVAMTPMDAAGAPLSTTDEEIREFEIHPEPREGFKIRPISKAWRHAGRNAAYRTAVCNVAYIVRDGDAVDEFGKMPAAFTQRRYELRASGMCLPNNAPEWASDGYRIWSEADANTAATGDATAASAWHVVGQIPTTVSEDYWEWLLTGFIKRELSGKGAVVAWAIHALQGDDGEWIVKPHFHLVVTRLRWRHRAADFGQRHPNWLSGKKAQARFQAAWFQRCGGARLGHRSKAGRVIPWMVG